MANNKKVEIGNIYNMGIGLGDSADCEVIRIEKDSRNGDMAVLEMVEFGGPLQKVSVAHLESKETTSSATDSQEQARRDFLEDYKNEKEVVKTLSTVEKLNEYTGQDIWNDVIWMLDEVATEAIATMDEIIFEDGSKIEYSAQEKIWKQTEEAASPQADQYRFQNGSLFEYDKEDHSYVHCFHRSDVKTKTKAIKAYEEECYV